MNIITSINCIIHIKNIYYSHDKKKLCEIYATVDLKSHNFNQLQ